MSEKIGCPLLSDSIEITKAAENYEKETCLLMCPHADTCRILKEGEANDSRGNRNTAT
jgi:hypothetical protein